ncbi:hypothetical protein GCM10023220_23570 [Streptomyces ziwulingensis]|uniref:Uncharacterized protein n=1 Tax=Streptomyces ziwulingensis TaxID=1045501 RepID=A0ABP9BIG9_9ACTN
MGVSSGAFPFGAAPSDTQNISTLVGVDSPRFRRPRRAPTGRSRRAAVHVSTSYRSGRPPGGRAGRTVRCGTLVHERLYDPGQEYEREWPPAFEGGLQRELREASTPVDRSDRGNQPIDRRVDTISKQYQAGSARVGGTQGSEQDGSDGGGAPWES